MEMEGVQKQCSFLASARELLFGYRWSGSGVCWCYVEVVLNHYQLLPLKPIRDATKPQFEIIKVGMDAFCTLFS